MKKKECSRKLPKPIKVYRHRGDRHKLVYVFYPNLDKFIKACRLCNFRIEIKTDAGKKNRCLLNDKDFNLKYYGIALHGKAKTWVDAVPTTLRKREPKLYAEIVSYFDKHRARSLGRGVLQSRRQTRQGKPHLADGKTSCIVSSKVKLNRSEGIEQPLKQ